MPDAGPIRLTIWGCRGSLPVGGPGTARYGGATACLVLEEGDRRLILDAGTGLRRFGRSRSEREWGGRHTILLSHAHPDHLAGLPFFPALYDRTATVEIVGPDQPTASLEVILARQFDASVWPLPPAATLVPRPIGPGRFMAGGFSATATRLAHAGVTLGYRIDTEAGRSVSYVTDNELGAMHPESRRALVHMVAGSDVLVHDATYTDALLEGRAGWGHSSAEASVRLGLESGCRKVVLFHHDPDADDRTLDERLALARQASKGGAVMVEAAVDGLVLEF